MENRRDEADYNLREWAVKARMVSRENTNSRRFSASYIRSFREDKRSFRSNVDISSTASSPGYPLREAIDPSNYSFTTALKALQARSVYGYGHESQSPEGIALNSKWNEAEKYICNPFSGEVPMECLSAKTLSGRSFRNLAGRITMSAPLIYPSGHSRMIQTKSYAPALEEKKANSKTRDVGTQSTPPELSSRSPSPTSTPSIKERSIKRAEAQVEEDSPISMNVAKEKLEGKVEVKETEEEDEEEEATKKNEEKKEDDKEKKAMQKMRKCSSSRQLGGCFSWRGLWTARHTRDKRKPRKKNILVHQHHVSIDAKQINQL